MEKEKVHGGKHVRAHGFRAKFWHSPLAIGIAAFLVGFIAIAIVWWAIPKGQQINRDGYQGVYLTNGQWYFGKLQNTEGTYLYMASPYMSQSTTGQATDTSGAITKVKGQLWGPEDSIAIRADQVSFWQNLRDDSKVSQAIKEKEN